MVFAGNGSNIGKKEKAKGWEAVNVILYIPPDNNEVPEHISTIPKAPMSTEAAIGQEIILSNTQDRVICTALTRTRENVVIYNASNRYKQFGELLPQHWSEQNLSS